MPISNDDLRRVATAVNEAQRHVEQFIASPGFQAAAKQATEAQRKVERFIASPGFQAAASRVVEAQRQVERFIASPGFQAATQQVAENVLRAQSWLREWDRSEQEIIALLAPRGWLISPTTSLPEIHALLALAEADGIDAVEHALIETMTPARCRAVVEDSYDRPSFASWHPVFEQALWAHEHERYALSVPIWLLAFDGIWRVELGESNIYSRVLKKQGALVRAAFPSSRGRLVDALVQVILAVAEHVPHSPGAMAGLRRHAVLHGRDPDFGTERASIQGILMLEALHYHLDSRE
jgi:hypothetical protein